MSDFPMKEASLPKMKDGNCGVTAVAVVAGVSFWESFSYIKKLSGHPGQWKGSTLLRERLSALKHFGVNYKLTDLVGNQIIPLHKWVKWFAKPNTTYVVESRRHVMVVKDGIVVDQTQKKPVDEFWAKQKRVRRIIEILP